MTVLATATEIDAQFELNNHTAAAFTWRILIDHSQIYLHQTSDMGSVPIALSNKLFDPQPLRRFRVRELDIGGMIFDVLRDGIRS
jgi:hypothetical protein